MWQSCHYCGDDPGSGLTSGGKVKTSHVSGPELRPWLAQWWDSRETQSVPALPVQTGKWLPACWCLIVCSCWFCGLKTKGVEAFSIKYKSLYSVSCGRLELTQSVSQEFLHVSPTYMDLPWDGDLSQDDGMQTVHSCTTITVAQVEGRTERACDLEIHGCCVSHSESRDVGRSACKKEIEGM